MKGCGPEGTPPGHNSSSPETDNHRCQGICWQALREAPHQARSPSSSTAPYRVVNVSSTLVLGKAGQLGVISTGKSVYFLYIDTLEIHTISAPVVLSLPAGNSNHIFAHGQGLTTSDARKYLIVSQGSGPEVSHSLTWRSLLPPCPHSNHQSQLSHSMPPMSWKWKEHNIPQLPKTSHRPLTVES